MNIVKEIVDEGLGQALGAGFGQSLAVAHARPWSGICGLGVLRAGWKGSNFNIFLVRGLPMVRVCAIVCVLRWLSV